MHRLQDETRRERDGAQRYAVKEETLRVYVLRHRMTRLGKRYSADEWLKGSSKDPLKVDR